MLDKTPLEMALEREGQIEYCDECEYVRVVDNTVFCGLSGKLLHPMMFLRGQGFGPARRCTKRKEAREMGLTAADLQRMGPEAQRQVMEKLGIVGKTKAPKYHNQPDSRGNLRFDSKKEARRYDELMLMLKAGQIRNLRLQQQYTLQESYITETGEPSTMWPTSPTSAPPRRTSMAPCSGCQWWRMSRAGPPRRPSTR
jgi:hypothetical protein